MQVFHQNNHDWFSGVERTSISNLFNGIFRFIKPIKILVFFIFLFLIGSSFFLILLIKFHRGGFLVPISIINYEDISISNSGSLRIYLSTFKNKFSLNLFPGIPSTLQTEKDILDFWKQQPFDLTIEEPWGNCDLCFLKSTKRRIAVLKQKPEIATFWSAIENEMGNKFDNQFSVKQLLKIATGQTIEDVSKFRNYDIDCTCNLD